MFGKCSNLVGQAKASPDPGYLLALLLLMLRSDSQGRITAASAAKNLRFFARDLVTYSNLLLALEGNILFRQYAKVIEQIPDIVQVRFEADQLSNVKDRLGTVAEYLGSLPTDKYGRIRLAPVQEKINDLRRQEQAIGRSH